MILMNDPQPIEAGEMGTAVGVDGADQIMVKWDNGRSLSVIPGEDKYEILENQLSGKEIKSNGTILFKLKLWFVPYV